jgi:drug/metabolite transporter (DMT)-like permease
MSSENISPEVYMQLSKSTDRVMNRIEWSLLLALSVLWGGSFFFSKVALAELPPLTLVLGRVSLAAIALNVIVFVAGYRMPRSLKTWGNPKWSGIDPKRNDALVGRAFGAFAHHR